MKKINKFTVNITTTIVILKIKKNLEILKFENIFIYFKSFHNFNIFH